MYYKDIFSIVDQPLELEAFLSNAESLRTRIMCVSLQCSVSMQYNASISSWNVDTLECTILRLSSMRLTFIDYC